MKKILITVISLLAIMMANAQTLSNTVWTYTQRMYGWEKISVVTSLFVFTSPTEVIWLFETSRNYMFPVGVGTYDAQKHTIVFTHANPSHKRISLYYGKETIKFEFSINQNNEAAIRLCNDDEFLKPFYNNGDRCNLVKEKYSLQPNSGLVGTSWRYQIEEESGFIYFKSKYEVLIEGEPHLYVSFGNNVFIKSGDNLSDENLAGTINGNEMIVRRDGLGVFGDEEEYQYQIPLKRIE